MKGETPTTTATLLASVGKQQTRLVSLVHRLQDQRLKYARLVDHYELRLESNSTSLELATPSAKKHGPDNLFWTGARFRNRGSQLPRVATARMLLTSRF